MKGFHRLSKVTGKLYLVMFLMALAYMLINTIYICADRSGVNAGISIEDKITADIDKAKSVSSDNSYNLPNYGLDLSDGIYDKMEEMLGYILAVAGIFFLLFIREISFTDIRTREFEQTLPVKKSTLVMHEYWFFFLLIVIVTFLQGFILYAFQTHYNNVWVGLSGEGAPAGFNSIPAQRLFAYIAMYAVNLILAYTWIYLGMVVCRNSLLGGAVSVGTMIGINYIHYNFDYEIADFITNTFVMKYPGIMEYHHSYIPDDPVAVEIWHQKSNFVNEMISIIVNAQYRFYYLRDIFTISLDGFEKRKVYHGLFVNGDYEIAPAYIIVALFTVLAIGVLLIYIAAKKRQLSKGGRFSYFTVCEYLFAVFCGIIWFLIFYWDISIYTAASDGFIIFSTIAVTLVIAFILHPVKFNKKIIYNAKRGIAAKCFLSARQGRNSDEKVGIDTSKDMHQNEKLSGKIKNSGERSSDIKSQMRKLVYSEGTRYLMALLMGLLAAFIMMKEVVNSLNSYDSFYYEFDERIKNALIAVSYYFNNFADTIIFRFNRNGISIISIMVIILLISKLFGYWVERRANTRDFLCTLPVKRGMMKGFSITGDLLVTIIPVIFAGVYVYAKAAAIISDNGVELKWLGESMAGIVITDIAYIVMLVGLLHFMEEMFRDGMMRLVAFVGSVMMAGYSFFNLALAYPRNAFVQFIYGVFSLGLPGGNHANVNVMNDGLYFMHSYIDVPVYYNGELLSLPDDVYAEGFYDTAFYTLFDYSRIYSYISYVLFYLAFGIILLVLAYNMACRKDLSTNGFNFGFGKYIIAGIMSVTVFCMVQPYTVAAWHELLVVLVCIIIFAVLVFLMTPVSERKMHGQAVKE